MSAHQPDLYHIPRAQKDITRFVWTALGLFTMIVLMSLWAATEYAAWALQWSPMLGKPMIAPAVYFPTDILIWTWKYNSLDYGLAVMKVFENAHLIMGIGGLLSLLMPVALAFRRTRKAAGEKNDLHGSAHWGEPEEVEATGLLPNEKNAGGVFFGDYDDQYLRHAGPEHILAFAPTRSGKGVGIILPTLLSWKHSVLVNDIKGECWHFTSGWRSKALGQRCIKFDPASPDSARFNPLMEIRMDGNLIKDVQNIATMIVDPDGKGLNDHWAKTGFDLMTGIVLFVLLYDPITDKSLATVQAILSDGGPIRELAEQLADAAAEQEDGGGKRMEGSAAVMTAIRDTAHAMLNDGLADEFSAHGWRAAAQAAQSFLNKAGNEASGVQSTALSFLSLYRDPIVAENTRVSDFTLESLMQQATSLYLVVSPSDKDRLKPLLRLILNQTVRRLTESMDFDAGGGKSRYPHRLLLAIDEFPSLGKLDVFQEALAFIAGYGMKALLIVQDLSQLYAAYTKDESIISNCHIRIAYAPNKIETAELLSKMAGTATVEHTQRQYSGNRLAVVLQNVNTNEQIVSRPLLTADECMRLPPDDELVFVAGHAPIYAKKIIYYKDPEFAARCAIPAPQETGRGKD
ncbi:MAG: type IV secretory system conjugative DNA transfer family protein [Thiomonas arsenitoxydans]|uniref:Type IV secretory system conjugative DNA transfer family protein n=1 Tax=Thiomonas arsenitoxydans (strain DSM 22701 / CIP 110005 / 3As) TaxID=426114 RepID=A0A8I1MX13_THIA3|nr:type IV secretory system conjugative DNA transfer family protein [Thiomonas arsenitoxydans]MBN8744535.1 type IV secretory system conjugative DNA transfer family protein [Thiomonas arsenitoxydans]